MESSVQLLDAEAFREPESQQTLLLDTRLGAFQSGIHLHLMRSRTTMDQGQSTDGSRAIMSCIRGQKIDPMRDITFFFFLFKAEKLS